jgi:hypothetical protein
MKNSKSHLILLSKTVLLIFSFILISIESYSQCSVSRTSDETDFIILNKSESIYKNEDLENGLKAVFANCKLIVNKIDKNKVKFRICIRYVKTADQPIIVPRSMSIRLKNGQSLSYEASTYDSRYNNGAKIEECYFNITLSDKSLLQENPIVALIIKDTRTNLSLSTNPFSSLFQEQIKCLFQEYENM